MQEVHEEEYEYDVCLSFAGEQRGYVEDVARELRADGVRVFYDDYEQITLWGKNLYDHLDYIYSRAARFCVLFVSEDYGRKVWTNHERQSAQERALREHREYVLPVVFDETRLPGLRSTVGHVDARRTDPDDVAELIKKKIGPITKSNFVPAAPTLLYEAMSATTDREKFRVRAVATDFVSKLARATLDERRLVIGAFSNRCPNDDGSDPHANLDYLRRVLGVTPVEAAETARGLGSLGFASAVKPHGDDDVLHLKWQSRSTYIDDDVQEYSREHSAELAVQMVVKTLTHLCEDCAERLAHNLDFSPLDP